MSESEKVYVHLLTAPWGIGSYKYIDEEGEWQYGYGFYRPENPHHFSPDQESCRPKEIEAHKAACEAWDKAPQPAPVGSKPEKGEQ